MGGKVNRLCAGAVVTVLLCAQDGKKNTAPLTELEVLKLTVYQKSAEILLRRDADAKRELAAVSKEFASLRAEHDAFKRDLCEKAGIPNRECEYDLEVKELSRVTPPAKPAK